jgi:hypothetical protein
MNTPSGSLIGASGDGFYIGFEGTTFNFTNVQSGLNTHVPKSAWNGDPLDGSSASGFTSEGVPEPWNPLLGNVYRIHGAWFGFGPIALEMLSPDGVWIVAHTFTYPNTGTTPYAFTNNFQCEMGVGNSGNTTSITLSNPCICLGTTDVTLPLNSPITDQTDSQPVRAVLCGKYATASTYLNVTVDSAGNLFTDINAIGGSSVVIAKPGVILTGMADGTGNALGSINGALKVTEAGALHAYGQVSCTSAGVLILAANASRKSLTLSNPTGSVIVVYIGDVSVTASTGFPLNPGQTVRLETVSAVYGITSSTSQTVGYIEIQ